MVPVAALDSHPWHGETNNCAPDEYPTVQAEWGTMASKATNVQDGLVGRAGTGTVPDVAAGTASVDPEQFSGTPSGSWGEEPS